MVAVVAAASAKSVGSATNPQVTAGERSCGWPLRLRVGRGRECVQSAAPGVREAAADGPPGRAVEWPYRANQGARGVAAASLARFCLIPSLSPR